MSNKTTWENGINTCQSESTNPTTSLVSIKDRTTNDFLITVTKRMAWIGGYKNQNGTWAWSDESIWTGYENWYIPLDPIHQNQYLNNREDYLMFNYWDYDGAWYAVKNTVKQGSLCQYNPRPCEAGWQYSEFNGMCYQLIKVKTNWTEAIRTCKSATTNPSANLASISDQQTNGFLTKLAKTVSSWIGASRNSDGDWTWTDGTQWNYTNWGKGEPNNFANSEDYVLFNWPGIASGMWNDHNSDADNIASALCQYKLVRDNITTTTTTTTSTTTTTTPFPPPHLR